MLSTETKFFGICLKPFKNGTTRWQVHYIDDGMLMKLWPVNCQDPKAAKKNGWTYVKYGGKWPAYHFYLNEIGTSHEYLLKESIAYVLKNEHGIVFDNPNNVQLEVLN